MDKATDAETPKLDRALNEQDTPEDIAAHAAIKKWRKTFDKAGFGAYAIDFTGVNASFIDCLGEALEKVLNEQVKG